MLHSCTLVGGEHVRRIMTIPWQWNCNQCFNDCNPCQLRVQSVSVYRPDEHAQGLPKNYILRQNTGDMAAMHYISQEDGRTCEVPPQVLLCLPVPHQQYQGRLIRPVIAGLRSRALTCAHVCLVALCMSTLFTRPEPGWLPAEDARYVSCCTVLRTTGCKIFQEMRTAYETLTAPSLHLILCMNFVVWAFCHC